MIEHNHEQNTPEWINARLSIPTGSSGSKLVTSKGEPSTQIEKYAMQLAREKYTGKPIAGWSGNADTEYGHEYEEQAALYYSMVRNADVETVGFCTDDLGRYGASPDRRVVGQGLLELKCFPKTHMEAILYWLKHKKVQPAQIIQPHFQMLVCDEPWCDLLYYDPDLPKVIVRIERDPAMDKAIKTAITNVISKRDEFVKQLSQIEELAA